MQKTIPTLDWELLSNLSYQSQLGKSLKNTLRKFDKEKLFDELSEVISYFTEIITEQTLSHENRIKSLQSCILKYEKYYPSTEVEKVFNDILGLRVVIDDYSVFDNIIFPKNVHIADMRKGKAKDDGYRGIHVYFQKDHFHYPKPIQRGDEETMCYLIAKKFDARGCIAVETERGKALSALVSYLGLKTLDKGIQILTVTDMDAFGEYKPYTLVSSEKEFISEVLSM